MASTYPGAIDNFSNPTAVDPLSNPAHASQHSNSNDAIEAIEGTLGVNPQGVYATVGARMAVVDNAAASAAVSASAAAVSASAALVSQLDSAQSANDAEQWATKLVDPVEGSEYSAKYWAQSASVSASLAASIYDQFDDRFLGAKASDPSVDNDGNPLQVGALYFNTTDAVMRVWTGTAWVNAVDTPYSWTGPVAISASVSTAALRVTQMGTGNALLVEDSTSPDSTPFVVDAAGNVGIAGLVNVGDTTAVTGQTVLSALLSTDTAAGNNMALRKCNSGPNSANFLFAKGRGSAASPSAVQENDTIGNFIFSGFDGTNYINAAYVQGAVDGTPGTNDMPGRLVFWTTPDGSANPQERMRINNNGNVGIGTSSPANRLTIQQQSDSGLRIQSAAGATETYDVYRQSATGLMFFDGTQSTGFNGFAFRTTPSGGSLTERLRITTAGNVGIGTTTPGYALDVNGTVNASAVFVNGAPVSAGGGAGLQDVFFLMGA